jgi:redox-sensitive bicupin YhaK (pirin superfamily)
MLIVEPRVVKLTTRTEIDVRRNLPHARLRRIGAWVFLDHFGPTAQVEGMKVDSHPHTGLQTVTWPFAGRMDHRDSIGSAQILEPGEVNLMTAGRGIAHSEVSLPNSESLHAAQLWIALPSEVRNMQPAFEHHGDLPIKQIGGATMTVFLGEHLGTKSPATVYSPLVGAKIRVPAGERLELPVDAGWEHGILVVSGDVAIDEQSVDVNELAFFEAGPNRIAIEAHSDALLLLVGGKKFEEELFLWWNFVARSHAEVVEMREQWNAQTERFGKVTDNLGGWIPAPELPGVKLKAR